MKRTAFDCWCVLSCYSAEVWWSLLTEDLCATSERREECSAPVGWWHKLPQASKEHFQVNFPFRVIRLSLNLWFFSCSGSCGIKLITTTRNNTVKNVLCWFKISILMGHFSCWRSLKFRMWLLYCSMNRSMLKWRVLAHSVWILLFVA